MPEFRLRRVSFDGSHRLGSEEPNPFERLTRHPDHGSPLRICLDTSGLATLSPEQALIVNELCAHYRQKAIQVTRTPGSSLGPWREFPTFEVERWSEATGTVWVARGESRIQTGFIAPKDWSYKVRTTATPQRDRHIVELLTARALGDVDLIVTADDELLALRSEQPLHVLPLLSPHEAFPIVGIWSRAIGQSYLSEPINISDWYPVVVAHVMVRQSWADLAVLSQGASAAPNGVECGELAGSILIRLARMIAALDELALKWLRRSHDGGAIELDQIVLGVSAIQDNLALLAGRFLGIQLAHPLQWSLRHSAWRKAVAAVATATDKRGKRLRDYVVTAHPWLSVAQELRQHAAHLTVLPSVRHMRFPHPEDRIRLPAKVAAAITTVLRQLRESPRDWGIRPSNLAGDATAELDALPFGAQLIAGTASLINGILLRLAPSGDSRYPYSLRVAATSGQTPFVKERVFSEQNCKVAILSSPLSGS